MGREESQEWDLSGQVQGVGLIGWVNTRPMVCDTPSAQTRAKRALSASNVLQTTFIINFPRKKEKLETNKKQWN